MKVAKISTKKEIKKSTYPQKEFLDTGKLFNI